MSTGLSWLIFGAVIGFGLAAAYAASVWACRKELNRMKASVSWDIEIPVEFYGGVYDCVARGEFDA